MARRTCCRGRSGIRDRARRRPGMAAGVSASHATPPARCVPHSTSPSPRCARRRRTAARQPRADAVRVVGPTHRPGGGNPGAHLVDAARREAVDHRRADPMPPEQVGPRRDPRRPHRLAIQAAAPVEQHDEGKRACALRPVDRHRKQAIGGGPRVPLLGRTRPKGLGIARLPGDEDGASARRRVCRRRRRASAKERGSEQEGPAAGEARALKRFTMRPFRGSRPIQGRCSSCALVRSRRADQDSL